MQQNFIEALGTLINIADTQWDKFAIDSCGLWENQPWNFDGYSESFEIAYFTEGTCRLEMNGKIYRAGRGDVYFTDISYPTRGSGAKFKLYYVSFCVNNPELYKKVKGCFSVLSECIQPGNLAGLESSLSDIHTEYLLNRSWSSLYKKCFFLEMLLKLYRGVESYYKGNAGAIKVSRNESLVNDIMQFANRHYSNEIRLETFAEKFCLNSRSLNIVFKSITGTTIMKYLVRLRVGKAKKLLQYTRMDVTSIALESGFCDCQHFCKTFKALIGKTPMQFRNGM